MNDKTLIFIPYQDSDNFFDDGILTREFAMLYLFWSAGYKKIINVKKPRTFLDKKRYKVVNANFPDGTVECEVKKILEAAQTIQELPFFSFEQVVKRRGWWKAGYEKTIKYLKSENVQSHLVYSDNPFAVELITYLHEMGAEVYFDIMDNFAIHPSLNQKEQMQALEGYKKVLSFSEVVSANSQQTCEYMKKYSHIKIELVKNGVFLANKMVQYSDIEQIKILNSKKKCYKKCVGYIGKLGQRLDATLIKNVSEKCPEILFVFVGGYLKGQVNPELLKLFEDDNNVLHISSIPSAYVYTMCDQFDILAIPHACGKSENGGDPLKLYQYLTRRKPIITTPILGVDEFKDIICISSSVEKWVEFINDPYVIPDIVPSGIAWEERMTPIMEKLKKNPR